MGLELRSAAQGAVRHKAEVQQAQILKENIFLSITCRARWTLVSRGLRLQWWKQAAFLLQPHIQHTQGSRGTAK